MTSTTLIEPPSGEPLVDLPPLLSIVPTAGPAAFVYVGFGAVLLLLLVPPITLLATLAAVALVVATAVAALVVLIGAILEAPFLLVRVLRGHPLGHVSLPVLHIRKLKPRRV
jgi:hypothetical protein